MESQNQVFHFYQLLKGLNKIKKVSKPFETAYICKVITFQAIPTKYKQSFVFITENSTLSLRLIDSAVVVFYLLMFKVGGVIGILKITFFIFFWY